MRDSYRIEREEKEEATHSLGVLKKMVLGQSAPRESKAMFINLQMIV